MTGRSSDKARVIDGLSYVSLGSYQGVCRMRCILMSTYAVCVGLELLVYEAFALSYWCVRPAPDAPGVCGLVEGACVGA